MHHGAALALGLALLALAPLLPGCGATPLPPTPPAQAFELREAQLVEGQALRRVQLPDPWEASAHQRRGSVRYRIALPDPALGSPQSALYVPRIGNLYRIHLNGQALLSVGVPPPADSGLPLPDFSQTPVLLPLPAALLGRSTNQIEIEVIGEPRRDAGLSSVWVGPLDQLELLHTNRTNRQVRGTWVLGAASAVMGALALLLAWRARRPGYAFFGVASLLWAWRLSVMQAPAGTAVTPLGAVLFDASYAWFVVLMAFYALDAVGLAAGRSRRCLLAWAALTPVASAAAWALNAPSLRSLVLSGTLACAVWLASVLVGAARRERTLPTLLLAVAAAAGAALGARDFLVLRLLQQYGELSWARYVILLLLAVLAWLLADEFARSSTALRSLNRDLQDRVAQKERELQAAFDRTRERERDQAVLAERDRILREMHDGLGGRLVAALALTSQLARQSATSAGGEPRPVEGPLRDLQLTLDDCLVELRLALDSLEHDRRPLIEALAELRFRVEPSLRACGVRLVWQLSEAASTVELPAAETLHVLRIVREALTNVLKHAHASVVWLRLELRADGALSLAVIDNGQAQSPPAGTPALPLFVPQTLLRGGRGLASMQRRAEALGAQLSTGPQQEGWGITLVLPARA